ncbi:unnamed protein product, partial [Candidula unifasciata]
MLVVKMKGENQNASLKKRLTELQDEIKRLSEEQKKIVVRVRENLVKSNPQVQQQQQQQQQQQLQQQSQQLQQQSPVTPIATIGQTLTAIGQPRIVSFPTQGGATILPVGMVAVPLAHMQRPVGVTLHPGNTGSMSQATSISLIPAGIIRGGCNISLSPINSGATISLGNTVSGIIHGSIGVSHLSGTNHINTTTNGSVAGSHLGVVEGCNQNTHPAISSASNGASLVSTVIPSSGTALTNLTNMTNLIIGTNISNGQNGTSHPLSSSTMISGNCAGIVPNTSTVLPMAAATPVNTITVSSSAPGIVISQFPQQPLVQPQLLQQQQQQILQMIQQQQQQQQPQQRLASHTPIKVPQYTASIIRPAATSASVQVRDTRVVSSPTASIPQQAKPAISKETTVLKEQLSAVKVEAAKPHQQQPAQPQTQPPKPPLEGPAEQPMVEQPPLEQPAAVVVSHDQEKLGFMKVLDLYTIDAIKEVMNRRMERKRRTTANPNYSFGFEFTFAIKMLWTSVIINSQSDFDMFVCTRGICHSICNSCHNLCRVTYHSLCQVGDITLPPRHLLI